MESTMKKLPSLKKLVKKLDDVFQMCIRYRDGFTCITCGKKFPVGERTYCHAGHFISRKHFSTRWDESNVACQCASCNLKQSFGDVETIHRYEMELKQRYGEDIIEELIRKSHQVNKLSRPYLEDMIEFYSKALEEYKKRN